MNRVPVLLLLLLLTTSCVPWGYYETEPFAPSAKDSDLDFIRTGDYRYYYVIDKRRNLCFFHAKLYGRSHLTPIDCAKLPEHAAARQGAKGNSAPQGDTPSKSEAPPGAPPPEAKKVIAAPPLTTANREAFRRVYIQYFCARKKGQPEELDVVLSRHGLSRERYEQSQSEFSRDKDLWSALSKEASEACQ